MVQLANAHRENPLVTHKTLALHLKQSKTAPVYISTLGAALLFAFENCRLRQFSPC